MKSADKANRKIERDKIYKSLELVKCQEGIFATFTYSTYRLSEPDLEHLNLRGINLAYFNISKDGKEWHYRFYFKDLTRKVLFEKCKLKDFNF